MYVTAWSTFGIVRKTALNRVVCQHTAVNGIGFLVRNLDAELLFNGHDYLDGVQAVQTQIILEVRCAADLVAIVSNRDTCCKPVSSRYL